MKYSAVIIIFALCACSSLGDAAEVQQSQECEISSAATYFAMQGVNADLPIIIKSRDSGDLTAKQKLDSYKNKSTQTEAI